MHWKTFYQLWQQKNRIFGLLQQKMRYETYFCNADVAYNGLSIEVADRF